MYVDRRRQKTNKGDVMVVGGVISILLLLSWNLVDASGAAAVCPPSCRCSVGSTVVVSCSAIGRVPVPLPPSTAVLLLDHNHISLLTNASFGRGGVPLRRLEELSIEDNGLLHIESGALELLTELRVLRLGRNHLSSLPLGVFETNRKLAVLDVHANYLSVLPDAVLPHLHSLNTLNVSFNHLTSARLGPGFRYSTQLSYIDLSGNDFESISSDVFEVTRWWDDHVPRHINLSYCDIRYVGERVFSPVPSLRSLSLAGNVRLRPADLELAMSTLRSPPTVLDTLILSHANISDVESLVRRLQTATNVTRLDLAYNRIRDVPKRTFFFLSALRRLDLSHNEIVRVDGLSGLAHLEYLSLAFNALDTVQSSMFEGLHELRHLDISYNAIVGDLDAEALLGLFNLRSVDISGNRVRGVVLDGGGLESLEVLTASWNRISDVRFVGRLPRLRSVDLSHNAIARVADDLFPLRGQRIELLNLSGNSISGLAAGALRQASFGTVDLSWNKLTTLDNVGCKSVEVLLAHDNDITQVTDAALRSVRTSLLELYLQRNRLQTLPQAVFYDKPVADDTPVLRVLDVSSNPLGSYVDSLTSSRSRRRLLSTLEVLRLRDVGLSRWPASLLRGLDALITLDLGENRLTTIPAGALEHLARLERLDASLNRIVGVDPWRLMIPSNRQPPRLELSDNPLDCTCSLAPFCRHQFPASTDSRRRNSTASSTLYRCRTPAEWHGVMLAEFCVDADAQCSTLPSAVLAASVGALLAVVVVVAVAIICRRCVERRRRHRSVPVTKAAAAAAQATAVARCRSSDKYQFVDETSLTSSSNSSNSGATTTSAVPLRPPPLGPHHCSSSLKLPYTTAHGHDNFLLASGRQWL